MAPTEATVATTSIRIDASILERYSPLPVGRAMPGSEIFIVNGKRELLPGNQRGEIIIAGPNVSPGYLARPELTADAFFSISWSARLSPGDLGRLRDNLLFFEGRMDEQIKLSGYRIELGDVEVNLRALAVVRDAVRNSGNQRRYAQSLAAFVVMATTRWRIAFRFIASAPKTNSVSDFPLTCCRANLFSSMRFR